MSATLTRSKTLPTLAARASRGSVLVPRLMRGIAWLYIAAVIVVTVFPFYWMLRTAFSNNYSLNANPGSMLPVGFTLGPFERVLGLSSTAAAQAQGGSGASVNIAVAFANSVIYASATTFFVVLFSTFAAYAFARLQWPGRNVVYGILLSALMVPGLLTFLPNFLFIRDLGLLNTYPGMILPNALFSAFDIFFLRQFMLGLSSEVEEAARLDGAGPWRVLFRITIPMTSGPLTTLCILGFITMWNDYFWPLLVSSSPNLQPLTLALAVFSQSSKQSQTDWAGLMAATLLAAAPMLVLFLVFGKRIVNSIGFTGVK